MKTVYPLQTKFAGGIKNMCGSGQTLKILGYVGRILFLKTFFFEYLDLLGNVLNIKTKLI